MSDERADAELAELLDDVVIAVDDDLRHHHAPWDLAAVLARAHQLDPEVVPLDWVREVEADAPVVSLAHERRARRITHQDHAFEELLAGVRASVEHDAAIRTHAPSVRPPAPSTAPIGVRRWLIATVAVAAAAILAVGLIEGVAAIRSDRSAPADAALLQGAADHGSEPSTLVDRPRETTEPTRTVPSSDLPREAAPLETIAPSEPRPAGIPERASRVPGRSKAKPVEPALPSFAERLAALDDEANAALAAKDYDRASELFERVIAQAGKASIADLAYGDLFNIARMRGRDDALLALWRRYVQAWPHGRFADDARAGLCRRGGGDAATCWDEYLQDFPKGSYRKEAGRAIGK